MLDRRQFLQIAAATSVLTGGSGGFTKIAAKQTITHDDLMSFNSIGQVTLLNFTDCHAQLVPLFFREPSSNLGVGDANGLPPHLTGKEFLSHFNLPVSSPRSYAFTFEDFVSLSRSYGRVGGLDRMAALVNAIRAERPGKTLLLDGGDTWQGSYTSLKTKGADMVEVMNALGVEGMTAHWEFTYGSQRVEELKELLNFPFLAGNVKDTEWEEEVFDSTTFFERGGIKIAVIGQAFPYTPVANPRYMFKNWSFGIREKLIQKRVSLARDSGAQLVVLLSHNGFDVDRKLASRVKGIDVILTGHTHDALPEAINVNNTLLVASGSHGKFLARLDLDIVSGQVRNYAFKLIPIFSDVIKPDRNMQQIIKKVRAPFESDLSQVLGETQSLLYRRGNFNGTFDDMICAALLKERDAQISLSPGFRWGASLLPGQKITVEDIYNHTAITYPNVYRNQFTGAFLKDILEDVADNLFNIDPYYQQGGDMVRVGGMGYQIDIDKPMGKRISNMTLLKTGESIDPARNYIVAGWASVNEGTSGPAIYDLMTNYVRSEKSIKVPDNQTVKVVRGK